MALLTVKHRKAIFQYLGYGEYNKESIKAFQKKYLLRKSDWDGIYGQNTDNALRTVYYTKRYCKNFKPEEFRCECGGKYCCGYPSYMKPAMLQHIQKIRDYYNEPITVTCGLRDKTYNSKLGGSIQNSLHMQGLAVDFFQSGVTDPLAKRKKSIKYIKGLKNHHYTYGNGINSYGNSVSAPYMGNCLHTDVYDNVKPTYPTYKEYDKVIDISEFQSAIDFKKVKADGIKGVIVRCGYRGAEQGTLAEDSMFVKHIKGAYEAGLAVGIYMFTEGITASEGKEEADYAIKLWKKVGVPLSYPIGVDSEDVYYTENGKKKPGRANGLTKAKRTEVIKAFCERIKELGYEPMIYASTSWLNNKLDMSKLPYKVWCAQYASKCEYKGEYILWQYTSEAKVSGYNGNIDMNYCYLEKLTTVEPPKESYTGTYPSLTLKKTNAQVKADTVRFAKWIAGNNDFHYGHGEHAHHNGCYFCGTQPSAKKTSGIVDWKKTYCCNPFVHACFAHGGCVPKALSMCQSKKSWDFGVGTGYDASSLFTKLGKPKKDKLEPADVLCNDKHVALYLGDGKIAEAASEDDNVKGSAKWKNSIHIASLTDKRYKGFKRVYRYNGSVNKLMNITHGEISKRVANLQKYLNWFGDYGLTDDGIFGDSTYKAVKDMQKKLGLTADGIVGADTLEAMKKVVK